MSHWRERVDLVCSGDWRILGEDEWGDLFVPTSTELWNRRFNPWNPRHWSYYLRSRRTLRMAMLERAS